ncbi:SBE2 (YDR351W) and SBE22 (YHR103W) [Zygosaccharomyces parabailii]|nr:SBE2 (YDR351W) and SBE22 (YHR103W) [Zygosaccharomyces parabailii]SJM84841.1 related to protein SBE22 [Zygosaccharomyces bailii]
MTSRLDTLKEETPPELPKGSRTRSGSSNGGSSRMMGLGLGRRPSDNLLLNMTSLEGLDLGDGIGGGSSGSGKAPGPPPPKKNFVMRGDRPISNDSIATRSTELFSSASSDVNSGSSSIDNEQDVKERTSETLALEQEAPQAQADESMISTDGEDLSPPCSQAAAAAVRDISSTGPPLGPQAGARNRFVFSNGMKAKSQIALKSASLHSENQLPTAAPQLPASSGLYGHSNSTSAILPSKTPLTPSQRYRLRKSQNETALRQSIRKKEKFYDEQEANTQLKNDNFESSLVWNVPMASFSTNSFLEGADVQASSHRSQDHHYRHQHNHHHHKQHSRNHSDPSFGGNANKDSAVAGGDSSGRSPLSHRKQQHNQRKGLPQPGSNLSFLNFYDMPTSPIPGLNGTSDFQYMQQASQTLSSVYENSSHTLSQSKLSERSYSADYLPMEFKTASDLGFEDLILVSDNKLEVTSHSRPSWLPPKSPEERKMHEEQISKSTSMASIEQLDRNKEKEERLLRNETNRQKYVLLLDRGITRNSSLQSLKKIIWETALTDEVRRNVYDEILQSDARAVTTHYLESYEDMSNLLEKMDFPGAKEKEIEQLIDAGVRNKLPGQEEISPELLPMLKMKSISRQGLQPGDELLFHHFLMSDSFKSSQEVWETANLVQMTCFNDLCKEKYDTRILNSRGIVANYLLRSDDFKDEFNPTTLNSTTWWNVLQRVSHGLFMWIMDIIVVANNQCYKKYPVRPDDYENKSWECYRSNRVVQNYKILLAFGLNVLLNYHFGFNDLKSLSSLDDPNFTIPMPLDHLLDADAINSMFIRKWLHYYKKF